MFINYPPVPLKPLDLFVLPCHKAKRSWFVVRSCMMRIVLPKTHWCLNLDVGINEVLITDVHCANVRTWSCLSEGQYCDAHWWKIHVPWTVYSLERGSATETFAGFNAATEAVRRPLRSSSTTTCLSLQELLVVDRDRVPGWVMSKRSALYCPQTLQNPKSLRSPPSMAQLSAAPTAKNGKWIEDIRIIQHLCPLKYQFKYLYPYLNLKW